MKAGIREDGRVTFPYDTFTYNDSRIRLAGRINPRTLTVAFKVPGGRAWSEERKRAEWVSGFTLVCKIVSRYVNAERVTVVQLEELLRIPNR